MSQPDEFEVGDWAIFQGRLCRVTEKTPGNDGPTYRVNDDKIDVPQVRGSELRAAQPPPDKR